MEGVRIYGAVIASSEQVSVNPFLKASCKFETIPMIRHNSTACNMPGWYFAKCDRILQIGSPAKLQPVREMIAIPSFLGTSRGARGRQLDDFTNNIHAGSLRV
jgi:hypothetical protein